MATEKNESNSFKPIELDGYTFFSEADAKLAQDEHKKVDYLMDRLDFSNPESIYRIYEKAVSERVFRTPVGLSFMKETRDFLVENPEIDSGTISPIPLPFNFENEVRKETSPARERVKPPAVKNGLKEKFKYSVILNLILAAMVIAMFAITINSEQPNILNYERALLNRYAGWEQELTEREQRIRLKERELNIDGQTKDFGG